MAIAEEQQCFIEEVQLRLPALQTSAVESASEADIYRGARPETTQRVMIRSLQVNAIPSGTI